MMKKIVAACLALTASIGVAQPPQSPPSPGGPPQRDAAHDATMKARAADDIALLLDLKPAQRPALNTYLATGPGFGPPMPAKPPVDRLVRPGEPGFIERLDAMEKQIAAEDSRRRAGIVAARSFYGQLDARQKQLFEALERVRHAPPPRPQMIMRLHHGGPGGPDMPPPPPPMPDGASE
ncbi:hypothetical protein FHS96_002052 [Sphingomonas zeicaulis]|uniref:Spy/CpxP family protein refolding chaperone n=1 Tax=Sphingomonas zeicaulis TaxID=1632740 RepID=UPI003D222064